MNNTSYINGYKAGYNDGLYGNITAMYMNNDWNMGYHDGHVQGCIDQLKEKKNKKQSIDKIFNKNIAELDPAWK